MPRMFGHGLRNHASLFVRTRLMPRMFGTDGVRGLANRDLTAQLALDLGDAAVRVLGDDERSEFESRRRALVGRDTRVSGDFLAAALSAGMSAST